MKHEDIDHTGLTGVGGAAHAADHENGGSDEIDVTGLAGAGGALSFLQNQIGTDVTLSTTYADGPAVTLSVGTWLLIGKVVFHNGSGGVDGIWCKLWDGTTVADSAESVTSHTHRITVPLCAVVVVAAGTPTWKISARTSTTGSLMIRAMSTFPEGNNASRLVAVKIA